MTDHPVSLAAAAVRLPAYLRLGWALARDPDLDRYSKGLLVASALYGLSPVDLVPGFVPVLGQLDDLLVLLYALRRALRRLSEPLRQEHLRTHRLSMADLDTDIATCRAALAAAARGTLRLTGRAAAWGARTAGAALRAGAGALLRALVRRSR